ncbi:hypothetical protein FE257_003348 [Aspergillus nanangensis]|uniref:Uncharacterized protein n=1 Tax=Aspergillus nanangensis TaxID=2582783 RepID=A0AAD4CSY9_ASPNN|nr:hypothetical protein FE257_003348 [Aspergillus nanangensis]
MACQVSGSAFITGGASGIGKGTAFALAKHGVTSLTLVDVHLAHLEETRSELLSQFPAVAVEIVEADMTKEASVAEAVQKTVDRFGRIDIAVNAAGIAPTPTFTHELELSEWQKVVDINQTGVWLCQRAQIRQMMLQESRGVRIGRGVIVNLSSMFGIASPPASFGIAPYTAAKYAVVAITKLDAKTYAKEGIRINAICPGWVDTPMIRKGIEAGAMDVVFQNTPLTRPASVDEIADSILFMVSPMSSYMCGTALVVDGGFTA